MGTKMNGSVDLLAKAMAQVISEATENAVEPINGRLDSIEGRMATKEDIKTLDAKIETTNENVHAQLAQQRKDISQDVQNIIGRNA